MLYAIYCCSRYLRHIVSNLYYQNTDVNACKRRLIAASMNGACARCNNTHVETADVVHKDLELSSSICSPTPAYTKACICSSSTALTKVSQLNMTQLWLRVIQHQS